MQQRWMIFFGCLMTVLFTLIGCVPSRQQHADYEAASKPLYRDPVYDGAADPVVVYNKQERKWFMFYTNRRANLPTINGFNWVHGTHIGIAESLNGGRTWSYRDTARINLPSSGQVTLWAPEVVEHKGLYHMFLTLVPGIYEDWGHTSEIVHLTSKNLLDWTFISTISLQSERVIDACVYQMNDGNWRMWYKDERKGSAIYYANSPDLFKWNVVEKAVSDRPAEAPVVFNWKGRYWMLVDPWNGIGVYSSNDLIKWDRQEKGILTEPGTGLDDNVRGSHPDVVVKGNRAFIFYFTHPGRVEGQQSWDYYAQRRSSLQVAELEYKEGQLVCNRNKPVFIQLDPKSDKKGR